MNKSIKTIAVLGLSSITGMYIGNTVYQKIASSKNILDESNLLEYKQRFGTIRYKKYGKGNPVLLIHNLEIGDSQFEYRKLIKKLARKNKVYAIDLLGYGLSDKPKITYTGFIYAQIIEDFVKNVIGTKTNIIATGKSASIAINACDNNRNIFKNIILINPVDFDKTKEIPNTKTKCLDYIIRLPLIGTTIFNIFNNKTSLIKKYKEQYYIQCADTIYEDVNASLEASHKKDNNSKYTFSSYIGKYMNSNITQALKNINNNIVIIIGKELPEKEKIEFQYQMYNSAIEVFEIEESKELPHIENPKEVIDRIRLFI